MSLFNKLSIIATHYNEMIVPQYEKIKAKYPEALLLYRIGDFYEAYNEDATTISAILGTVLCHRDEIPVTGFPAHALDGYIAKLVRTGSKVALYDPI